MKNFTIISNAETVNKTYNIHQIDLDTMLHDGQCHPEDEIVFDVDGDNVKCYFKNGGHLIDPSKDKALATALAANREKLNIYQ